MLNKNQTFNIFWKHKIFIDDKRDLNWTKTTITYESGKLLCFYIFLD